MVASEHLSHLQSLYEDELKTVIHPPLFVHGLIFAVASSPEIPMPESWLGWVFQQHGQLQSEQQADQLTNLLMSLLQEQLGFMRTNNIGFPDAFSFDMQGDEHMPVSQWLNGLLAGHSRLESVWQVSWQQLANEQEQKISTMQRDLKHCLMMFSTFANLPLAINKAERLGNHQLLEKLPHIFHSLPDALKTYVDLSGQLAQFLPDQFETFNAPH